MERRSLGDMPSGVLIIHRHGTWNDACTAAGLHVTPGGYQYRKIWPADDVLTCVVAFMDEASDFTVAEYDRLARQRG